MSAGLAACAAGIAGLGIWLAVPASPTAHLGDPSSFATSPESPAGTAVPPASADPGWMLRWRWLWSVLAAGGALAFLGGHAGLAGGVIAGVGVSVAIGRAEPPSVRRRRESVRRDLPHLVSLLSSALAGGADPRLAVAVVAEALPGPAGDGLGSLVAHLDLGVDPVQVWEQLAQDPSLGPLGRALARAAETGAPVSAAIERLAVELSRDARADVEDRARQVGVKAALPLGLCLLPAFLLVGIVPLVGGLVSALGL